MKKDFQSFTMKCLNWLLFCAALWALREIYPDCPFLIMRNKILMILNVLQERGNQLREPYSKHLEDGIFEVRGKVGNDISRVLYFFYYNGKIIMTNGFIKKTQKTPKSEIELAKKYRKEYLERFGE